MKVLITGGARFFALSLLQARPPTMLKRPSSNVSLESSCDQPQPYRSLKEVELIEGDDLGLGAESHTAPPSPVTERFSNVNLLGDVFGCQDEPEYPSAIGNITIPRPHGRKTPELGSVLAPPAVQSWSKATGYGEGRTTPGREEFRQALSMTSNEYQERPTRADEDVVDLISLLDPLNSSAQTNLSALTDQLDFSASSACKPTLPPRPYPQGLPLFPLYPHISLNPFAQSLQHYSPTVSGNPFSTVYGPPPGSYIHASSQPQSFSTLPGLHHRQLSPCSSTLPPSHGLAQSASPSSVTSLPRSSDSSHVLSSLVDSTSVFSTPMNTLPKPLQAQGENQKPKDPFGDLLNMATPVIPQKKKVEDLRRKWETFD
ncbi:hypothetical protein XENOCAPTIV_007154 [Xenoophorus captivus]|uniref:DENN/MADD domain containing 1A n=1 Tax=Xenoophorus captivus TaxID=1517983 RepID=A0ABV0RXR1_9TELE